MKKRISLAALKVESFVTDFNIESEVQTVKGGRKRGPGTAACTLNCTIGIPCNTDQDITKTGCTIRPIICGL